MSIETRNSVPSRSSLKEGQIVIAKDPKKGLSMFIKSGAETYSIPISSATKENVFDSMTINGNARINNKLISDTIDTRNLSYTKFTDYQMYTLLPFGRIVRDVAQPEKGLIDNPSRFLEKLAGMPLRDLQRFATQRKKDIEEGKRFKQPKVGF